MIQLSGKHEEIFTYEKPGVGIVGTIIYRVEETMRGGSLIKIKCLGTSNGDHKELESLGIGKILAEYKEKGLLYILFSNFFHHLLADPIMQDGAINIIFTPLIGLQGVYDLKLAPKIRAEGHTYIRDGYSRIIRLDN